MKIGGIDPTTLPCVTTLVLPRGDQGQLVFQATGLKDMGQFDKLCPEPVPPKKLTKEGTVADTDDKNYQTEMAGYSKRRLAYVVLNSLSPSSIEWDTVQLDTPASWVNWEDDLKKAGLSQIEIQRVLSLVSEANCLDESKLQKARELFLRGVATTLGT